MAEQIPHINVDSDTFQIVFDRINSIITTVNTDVVTVNTGGGVTTGNGYVIGNFGANVLATARLTGGNTTAPSNLNVSSNVSFTGLMINVSANTLFLGQNNYINGTATVANSLAIIGNVTLSNTLAVIGNVTLSNTLTITGLMSGIDGIFSNVFSLGNSSVNSVINSTSFVQGTVVTNTSALAVGANVLLNQTNIKIGNSTANLTANSTVIRLGNTTVNVVINTSSVSVGAFTATTLTGTLQTAAQPLVTSIGNLVSANIVGNANINSGLTVQGNTTVYAINATGNTILTGNLRVTGTTNIDGDFIVNGSILVSNTSYGNVLPASNLTYFIGNSTLVWKSAHIGNGIFTNAVTMANTLTVTGVANVTANLNVSGTINGNIVAGTANITSALNFGTNQEVQQRIISTNTAGATVQVIDTFVAASYRTAKYIIQVNDLIANNKMALEILLTHNGTTVYITEYATLITNSAMGTFSSNIGAGVAQLWYDPVSANTNVKLLRTLFEV